MNGLAQYGVGRGTVAKEIVIGTSDTPVPAAPWDSGGTADAVQLTKWIIDGTNPSEDGYFDTNCELGDICEVASSGALATFNYRGWHVEPYWSNRIGPALRVTIRSA